MAGKKKEILRGGGGGVRIVRFVCFIKTVIENGARRIPAYLQIDRQTVRITVRSVSAVATLPIPHHEPRSNSIITVAYVSTKTTANVLGNYRAVYANETETRPIV